jgi:hypothetical protein
MGPELTDDEIKKIYDLACQRGIVEYNKMFRTCNLEIPNIVKIKSLYDQAINNAPDIGQNYYTDEEVKKLRYAANICAVEKLKKL